MPKTEEELKEEGQAILRSLTPDERMLLDRVIAAEREKLHMSSPLYINDDLLKAVEDVIQ